MIHSVHVHNNWNPWTNNLFLQIGRLKSEEKLLYVILPQLVNAACVNGPTEEFIHFVLRVQGLLSAATTAWMKEKEQSMVSVSVCVEWLTATVVFAADLVQTSDLHSDDCQSITDIKNYTGEWHSLVFAGCFIDALRNKKSDVEEVRKWLHKRGNCSK